MARNDHAPALLPTFASLESVVADPGWDALAEAVLGFELPPIATESGYSTHLDRDGTLADIVSLDEFRHRRTRRSPSHSGPSHSG